MIKNKKASIWNSLLFKMFIFAVVLIIIISNPIPAIANGIKSIMGTNPNPCGCGDPGNGPEQIEHEGIQYCVYAHKACENLYLKHEEIYKTITYKRIDGADGVPRCVYVQSNCTDDMREDFY